jgi:molybdopterin-guanine dinucleotide biosynthesis protein A
VVEAGRPSLVIFAGGRATRLGGTNKALLEVGGRTILRRILDELVPKVGERIALAQDDGLATIAADLQVEIDPEPHAGVLPALAGGLAAAPGDLCLAVACDMPFVSAGLFGYLLGVLEDEGADVAIPRDEEGLQPMHAVYRRAPVLAAVRAALARGDQRMISYFRDVRVREVPADEVRTHSPDLRAFLNVNTPEELGRARALAG